MSQIDRLSELYDGEPIEVLDLKPQATVRASSAWMSSTGFHGESVTPKNHPQIWRYIRGYAQKGGRRGKWYFQNDERRFELTATMTIRTVAATPRLYPKPPKPVERDLFADQGGSGLTGLRRKRA